MEVERKDEGRLSIDEDFFYNEKNGMRSDSIPSQNSLDGRLDYGYIETRVLHILSSPLSRLSPLYNFHPLDVQLNKHTTTTTPPTRPISIVSTHESSRSNSNCFPGHFVRSCAPTSLTFSCKRAAD